MKAVLRGGPVTTHWRPTNGWLRNLICALCMMITWSSANGWGAHLQVWGNSSSISSSSSSSSDECIFAQIGFPQNRPYWPENWSWHKKQRSCSRWFSLKTIHEEQFLGSHAIAINQMIIMRWQKYDHEECWHKQYGKHSICQLGGKQITFGFMIFLSMIL